MVWLVMDECGVRFEHMYFNLSRGYVTCGRLVEALVGGVVVVGTGCWAVRRMPRQDRGLP
jgi:hypothetical protein